MLRQLEEQLNIVDHGDHGDLTGPYVTKNCERLTDVNFETAMWEFFPEGTREQNAGHIKATYKLLKSLSDNKGVDNVLDGGNLNCRMLKNEVEESRDIIKYARLGELAVNALADLVNKEKTDLTKEKFKPKKW